MAQVLLVSWLPAAGVEERASFDVDGYEHVLELGLGLGLEPALGPEPGLAPGLGHVPADGVEVVVAAAAAVVAQLVEIAGTEQK
jgi:hypothetical protein